jgi:hypothetical protein
MMNEAVVVFPQQLFERHPAIIKGREVQFAKDERFFHVGRSRQKKLLSIGLKTSCPD